MNSTSNFSNTQKTALISVSDKTGIVDFARLLHEQGWRLLSTGGTHKLLSESGLPVVAVSEVTSFPEMLDGRVKTLHPAVHGGILARREEQHLAQLAQHDIATIDLVCVNLYPFRETVARNAPDAEVIENIDIGGPAMIRSAAKNHASVLVVVDPADYSLVLQEEVSLDKRRQLAAKAYRHTSEYDAAITDYLGREEHVTSQHLPKAFDLSVQQVTQVRYGENPHQAAAIYRLDGQQGPVLDAQIVAGKPMSFNNYADAEAAWQLCQELKHGMHKHGMDGVDHRDRHQEEVVCVAVKHANPCGVALADHAKDAWERARDADTLSVFGGVVAISDTVDLETAQAMQGTFLEVLIASDVTTEAVQYFKQKKPNLRVLIADQSPIASLEFRSLLGGFAVQQRDLRVWDDLCPEVSSKKQPSTAQWNDLRFAWHVVKQARSNAVVLAKDGVTVGLGSGVVSRIWAAERAASNAGQQAAGAVLASEAFLPFDDVVELAAQIGVTAILQPGGAKRDEEVIATADRLGVSMVFTGSRHFRH